MPLDSERYCFKNSVGTQGATATAAPQPLHTYAPAQVRTKPHMDRNNSKGFTFKIRHREFVWMKPQMSLVCPSRDDMDVVGIDGPGARSGCSPVNKLKTPCNFSKAINPNCLPRLTLHVLDIPTKGWLCSKESFRSQGAFSLFVSIGAMMHPWPGIMQDLA